MTSTRFCVFAAAVFVLAAPPLPAHDAVSVPAHRVVGVEQAQLSPDFWIAQLDDPDRVVLDDAAIEAQNRRLLDLDSSMYDLRALPRTLTRQHVATWIGDLAEPPTSVYYDVDGKPVTDETLDRIVENRNLAAVDRQTTRYGLVVHRASLRTFPTSLRVFRSAGDTDIDRFQESALFPGTPVVIIHESLDGQWWFVVSPRYAAWIEKRYVAEGTAKQVFAYHAKTPFRIVTGATVETVFTPEQPALSELQLDMGVRVPVLNERAVDRPVNGQHPYTSYVIELPLRGQEGDLRLAPVLLQKNADTASDYLTLTRANIIRQGFKFLGERYGWGHSYNARDCSGFVSEVYSSMGVLLPRNTSDQSVSPALDTRIFSDTDDNGARMTAVSTLEVGDLVYIPGHVMMMIGRIDGEPWVIHDTTGISYLTEESSMTRVRLNSVSVTPLMPLRLDETERYVDRMTSIVRIRPDSAKEAPLSP